MNSRCAQEIFASFKAQNFEWGIHLERRASGGETDSKIFAAGAALTFYFICFSNFFTKRSPTLSKPVSRPPH
jgi:hypothetical protein